MHPNEISGTIIDTAYHIHKELGPGLLESVYQTVLAYELQKRGLHLEKEKPIPVRYEEVVLEQGFRADLIVENLVIVELKSVEKVAPVHKKQLLTYLRMAEKPLGLLLNFGAGLMKEGIFRVVNGLQE
ncbi:MAG: GxxExxY protein [Candidatus Parabeggiatoa sp.]|nr:GxxExxY protein [Candidatus Parabeggiatoa sp.]